MTPVENERENEGTDGRGNRDSGLWSHLVPEQFVLIGFAIGIGLTLLFVKNDI